MAQCAWDFYFPLSLSCFRTRKMCTRFSKVAKLFAAKANAATNCVRLFCQARSLVLELTSADVYYVNSLRISGRLEVCLWNARPPQ
ncbi:MAG: hypothetical protein ACKERG_00535 [Candidatus Hodgkinia cicadicola]